MYATPGVPEYCARALLAISDKNVLAHRENEAALPYDGPSAEKINASKDAGKDSNQPKRLTYSNNDY